MISTKVMKSKWILNKFQKIFRFIVNKHKQIIANVMTDIWFLLYRQISEKYGVPIDRMAKIYKKSKKG